MENPDDHHDNHSATSSHPTCAKCGAATIIAPPPAWSDTSPPPNYRPIRAPALNLPPNQQAIILAPVPQPQTVPLASPPYNFHAPSKRIHSHDDLLRFNASFSAHNFLGFLAALSHSVQGLKISSPLPNPSPIADSIAAVLRTLDLWIDQIPPAQQSARYGNASFRTWHDRLLSSAEPLMLQILSAAAAGDSLRESTVEIAPYFADSFGNPSRIDYGTGHETNFAAWLYCLARIGVITEEDYPAVVLTAFVKYVDVMRRLQTVYCLEPAGSHGVWGLDDYCFLPFIFGSSQLVDHKYMKPKSIHNQDIVENFAGDYMYLSSVAFVKKMKKGLFAEHSPLLDDISGVPNWKKVNGGLLKMYRAEVLEKLPIMQHFLFASLIKWEENN